MSRTKFTLRTRLERERRAAKLTQTELARQASVDQGTVSKLEARKLLRPSHVILDSLARALNRKGRSVEAADLQPRPQPELIKGVMHQSRKRGVA